MASGALIRGVAVSWYGKSALLRDPREPSLVGSMRPGCPMVWATVCVAVPRAWCPVVAL
jgi:hypothetical protein